LTAATAERYKSLQELLVTKTRWYETSINAGNFQQVQKRRMWSSKTKQFLESQEKSSKSFTNHFPTPRQA